MTSVRTPLFTFVILALVCLALPAVGQTLNTPPTSPAYILAFGGGSTLDGHYAMTGTVAVPIAADTYSLTSSDFSTVNVPDAAAPTKMRRVTMTTARTGIERKLVQAGPVNILAHVDAGGSFGNGGVVGLVSGGGTVTYDVPRHPNLFVYGTYRALRSPQADPSAATVQSAVSFGIGLKLFKSN